MDQPYVGKLAQLYDVAVPDWPGEIDFYRRLAQEMAAHKQAVLEVACGTGRVAVQLARAGVHVAGIDLSAEMLDMARNKSAGLPNARWMQADMRSFDLGEHFGLAIVPAYSFQLLLTENDQTSCLCQIARHLSPGARLVLHLERHAPDWLASLPSDGFTPFEPSGEAVHPITGKLIRVSYAWSYKSATRSVAWSFESATRSVAVIIRYETIEESGQVSICNDRDPLKMYCTFPHDMKRLLSRSGFDTEAIYDDFHGHPFQENSDEMIWVAHLR